MRRGMRPESPPWAIGATNKGIFAIFFGLNSNESRLNARTRRPRLSDGHSTDCAKLWNGQPLLYPDSVGYVTNGEAAIRYAFGTPLGRSWERKNAATALDDGTPAMRKHEDPVTLSRSVYYGLLAYTSYAAVGLWLTVLIQALAVGWLLYQLLFKLRRLRWTTLLIASAGLMCLTPLGVYTGFFMPDVLASTSILALSTLSVYWFRLSISERATLAALLLFGLLAHTSHLAMTVLLVPVVAWVARRAQWPYWRQVSLLLLVCVAVAAAANWGLRRAAESATGRPAVLLPHLTARLVDLGPGTRFLKANCPGAGFAACRFVKNYPTPWLDFLFSRDPHKGAWMPSDNEQQRQMSTEQVPLALAVLRAEPVSVLSDTASDILRQAVFLALDIWGYSPGHFVWFQARLPPEIREVFNQTRAVSSRSLNSWFSAATYVTTAMGLAFLLWHARQHLAGSKYNGVTGSHWRFSGLVIAGVLSNAIVWARSLRPWTAFRLA